MTEETTNMRLTDPQVIELAKFLYPDKEFKIEKSDDDLSHEAYCQLDPNTILCFGVYYDHGIDLDTWIGNRSGEIYSVPFSVEQMGMVINRIEEIRSTK